MSYTTESNFIGLTTFRGGIWLTALVVLTIDRIGGRTVRGTRWHCGNRRVKHEMVGYVPAIGLELTYATSTVTARDERGTSVVHRLLVCSGITVYRARIACHVGQGVDGCRDDLLGLRGCKYYVCVKLERTECTVQREQRVPSELQSFIPLISRETGVEISGVRHPWLSPSLDDRMR